MPVTYAPLFNDGTQLIDGVHDITVSNQASDEFLTTMGLPLTVPGQTGGMDLYNQVVNYMSTPEFQAFSQAKKDLWDRIRIAVATGARIESGQIGWRAA